MNFESESSAKQPLSHASSESDVQEHIIKKCSWKGCVNNVDLYEDKKTNDYVSKIMFKTAFGHRDSFSSFRLYHFCSDKCKNYFEKYCCCYECHEDCNEDYNKYSNEGQQGTFIKQLDYTLCNRRGDMVPSCMSDMVGHKLEERFIQEYTRHGYYEIERDVIDKLLDGNDKLKQIIANNKNMVSYNMLRDMYIFYSKFEFRERDDNNLVDEDTFYEYYNMIKDELL